VPENSGVQCCEVDARALGVLAGARTRSKNPGHLISSLIKQAEQEPRWRRWQPWRRRSAAAKNAGLSMSTVDVPNRMRSVGTPVILAGYRHGQAELEFADTQGDTHTIWVEKKLIRPA
jgi:hypothetical protein